MVHTPPPLRCLVLATLLAPVLRAQSWEARDEIAFARSLARYRMFDLAASHLEGLARSAANGEDQIALKYGQAQVLMLAGEHSTNNEDRIGFLRQAIGILEDFVAKAGGENLLLPEARSDLAKTHRRLGSMYGDLVAAGNDPAENRALAEKFFRSSVEILLKIFNENLQQLEGTTKALEQEPIDTNDDAAVEEREEAIQQAAVDAYEPLTILVETFYYWALLYDKGEFNRQDYLTQCQDKATEYIWKIGTENFNAYQVYLYDGLAHLELDKTEDGFARLDFIISKETGIPSLLDAEANLDLPASIVREFTDLYERTYLQLASFYNRSRQYAKTLDAGTEVAEFYKKFASRGGEPGDYGDEFQLELAIARFKTGDSQAMATLEEVGRRRPNDAIGKRAGEYISRLLSESAQNPGSGASGTGERVPPSIWITAADTDFRAGRFFDATDKYHEALGSLDLVRDEAERQSIVVSAWNQIGNCYRGLRRPVEASVAFNEGFRAAKLAGDQGQSERLAVAWYNSLVLRFKETRDKYSRDLKDSAMRELAKEGVENIGFLSAKDDFEQARSLPEGGKERTAAFADVIQSFQSVKTNDPNYERAQIYLARCEAEQNRLKEALQRLDAVDQYLAENTVVRSKQHDLARQGARTESIYYRADYLSRLGQHELVLRVIERFEELLPEQKSFFAGVNYQRIKSYVTLGRFDEAETLFESCREKAKSDASYQLPVGAQFYIAQGLSTAAEVADKGDRSADARSLRVKFIGHMYSYCSASSFDSYLNLRSVGDACHANATAGNSPADWAATEKYYGELLTRFEKDGLNAADINQNVKRRQADALMNQAKFQQAAALYKEQLQLFPDSPTVIRNAALCFGGWVKLDKGRPEEVPGSGDYVEAIKLWDRFFEQGLRAEDRAGKTPRFWEVKFFTIYTRYRARDVDASCAQQAKSLMKNLESTVLAFYPKEEWARTFGGGEDQDSLKAGEEWKIRFEYLSQRVAAL